MLGLMKTKEDDARTAQRQLPLRVDPLHDISNLFYNNISTSIRINSDIAAYTIKQYLRSQAARKATTHIFSSYNSCLKKLLHTSLIY